MENESPNLYRSPDGFSVEVLGRTGLRYREGGRSFFVDAEVLVPPAGIAVYGDSITDEEPTAEPLPVSPQVRRRILDNIGAVLALHGVPVDFLGRHMSKPTPDVPIERVMEVPGDVERLVRELLPVLAAGVLKRLDDDQPAGTGLELKALLSSSAWPDVIDAKFVDQHGQRYQLFVDVFHGSGGRWSRMAET